MWKDLALAYGLQNILNHGLSQNSQVLSPIYMFYQGKYPHILFGFCFLILIPSVKSNKLLSQFFPKVGGSEMAGGIGNAMNIIELRVLTYMLSITRCQFSKNYHLTHFECFIFSNKCSSNILYQTRYCSWHNTDVLIA